MQTQFTRAGDAERLQVLDTTHIVLVSGKDTQGQLSAAILETPPGTGVPPHVHQNENEWFHVLDGRFEFYIDGKTILAEPGSTFLGPRRIPHGFRCVGERSGRVMVTIWPASLDDMFLELSRLPVGAANPGTVADICARYGITFV